MGVHKKISARPFAVRRAAALPTVVLAVTTMIGATGVIGMAGPAGAASRTSSTVAPTTAGGMAVKTVIPEGFLLFESKKTRKETEKKFVRTPHALEGDRPSWGATAGQSL
ncbi:hypothetical protein ACLQ2R_25510 [Streptosporangium sp. DT93]|uniref:hypothetical protein n=1 Tax=Streptosporangium sp. DT93 TaxID=3393428 RepID=UPI003CF65D24